MQRPEKRTRLTIVSLGNCEVGKSCFMKRHGEQIFVTKYSPTQGVDYGEMRGESPDGKEVALKICDLSGNPYFYECRHEFYKNVHGAFLMYDVTSRDSFTDLESWLREFKQHCNRNVDDTAFVVCANKVDAGVSKRRAVGEVEGRNWAEKHEFPYFETSAMTGQNITDAFDTLQHLILISIAGKGKPRVSAATWTDGVNGKAPTAEQVTATERLLSQQSAYQKLGLSHFASKDDINKAYKKLAVLLHPDKNSHPQADEAFKQLAALKKELLERFAA